MQHFGLLRTSKQLQSLSLEEWMQNPPKGTEWVDGKLIQKRLLEWSDEEAKETGMTLRHSRIQSLLSTYWRNYMNSSSQGGEVYTEVPCRTNKQGRSPDVAYLTPELLAQYGDCSVLPQSFPLIAEIISPTDKAEEVFTKVREYLESGCQEVWLVFPESHWILIITQEQQVLLSLSDVARTQAVLQDFSVAVDELLS